MSAEVLVNGAKIRRSAGAEAARNWPARHNSTAMLNVMSHRDIGRHRIEKPGQAKYLMVMRGPAFDRFTRKIW